MEIVLLIVGVLLGFAIAWLYQKSQNAGSSSMYEEKVNMLSSNIAEQKQQLQDERNRAEQLSAHLASARTEKENLMQRMAEQKSEIEDIRKKFTLEFENLANRILEEKGKRFSDQSEHQLKGILDPLKDRLREFDQRIHQNHVEQEKERSALKEQLRHLSDLNKRMSEDANNLTKALKGEVKTQGNWGELILEKVLEKSGLRKGIEYDVQQSFTMEDGSRLQPDVVIHLPDNKNLIVDSKVSLVAYEKYNSSDSKEEQEKALREHILSLKNHIKGLSGKNYYQLYSIGSPDFVLLFIPIEPAFSLAVNYEDNMYNDAFEKNVIIVTPSTLLATLRTIANIWKQENQNKNVMEIARQSGELYDKFVGFMEDLIMIGNKLKDTDKAYAEAMKKLTEGKGNLVRRVESIKALGAKTSKSLPKNILDRAEEE